MEKLELSIKGLYLSPNDYNSVPQGALLEGRNGILDKESIFDSRRGQTFYSSTAFASPPDNLFNYNNNLLAHAGSVLSWDDGTGVFTNYSGSFSNPDTGYKIHSIEANKNLYFTTSRGIQKLDVVNGVPVLAGAPPGLDMTGSLVTGAYLDTNSIVAYRMLWGYKDANNNLVIGAPSQRLVISNTSGGSKDVQLSFTIPDGITTSWFYQVYRSVIYTPATVTPNDELYLCIEDNPTSGEITAKSVTVTDSTPDALLGVTLYTNPTQQGIENANTPPPLARDIAIFNNMTLYANTQSKQRMLLTLLGSGNPAIRYVGTTGDLHTTTTIDNISDTSKIRAGMKVRATGVPATSRVVSVATHSVLVTVAATSTSAGVTIEFEDVLTLAGTEYYASAATTVANHEFQVFTSGTPAENIQDTSLALITVINRLSSNTSIYAYYLSGFTDLPGQLALEGRTVAVGQFYATSTAGDSFNPTLPTSGTTVSSDDNAMQNGIFISKLNQPESVPLYAYVLVGSANKPIRRIKALRDSTFIFKDDGIFRFTGTDFQSIVVSLFDGSKKLAAYDSPAVFDNQIFCFVDQGIGAVSEQGVQIISKPIENQLLVVSQFSNFKDNTFGLGYDSDRKYYFWTVSTADDTYPTVCWVWNSITSTWTDNDLPRSCGIVNSGTNKLYMGNPVNNYVYVERKTFTNLDYADEAYPLTITHVNGNYLTVTDVSNVALGDAVLQGQRVSIVQAINGLILTVNYALNYANGAATINKPFRVRIVFAPLDADNPSVVKQFSECTYFFKEANFLSILGGWSSNNAEEEQFELPAPENTNSGFGTGVFGGGFYGGLGVQGGRFPIRTYVPLEPSRANWIIPSLELEQPFANISLMGLDVLYNQGTTKLVAA